MAGRPTKYKHKYINMMEKYFNLEPNYEKNGNKIASTFPTMEGFASLLNVNGDTLVEWANHKNERKYPGFSATYKRAKSFQIHLLITNGLLGLYNTRFAMFVCRSLLNTTKRRNEITTLERNTPVSFTYIVAK